MTRTHIFEEIKRTAIANSDVPLGWRRFSAETGIRLGDLHENLIARYSDACREAGYAPNTLTTAYDEGDVLDKYARLALNLGRLPGKGDLRVARHADPSFPNDKTIRRALGNKAELISKLRTFCETRREYGTVVPLCRTYAPPQRSELSASESSHNVGYVYLIKHGSRREYRIGSTTDPLRREGEIGIQLPEKVQPVHVIQTDDPFGIEAYWHRRFQDKRKNGDWFELSAVDVTAFRRGKFM